MTVHGVARQRGWVGGRRRQMTNGKRESARALLDGGMPPREVARNLGDSAPTLYRWLPAGERERAGA
jgi:DNA invertase Pin-like site-specific DNA recombinase